MSFLKDQKEDFGWYSLGLSKLKPEMRLQIAVMNWLEAEHFEIYEMTFASAGGLRTSVKQGALMKSAGYKKGTPDLFFAIPSQEYHGLWLELKASKKSDVSKEQRALCHKLQKIGYASKIVIGWDATLSAIKSYFGLI